ncbi:MAG: hypothetical protein JNL39_17770 [Opitutaceae bacterium]|nr:hypothetical protein [Opitutaceae bacterium]
MKTHPETPTHRLCVASATFSLENREIFTPETKPRRAPDWGRLGVSWGKVFRGACMKSPLGRATHMSAQITSNLDSFCIRPSSVLAASAVLFCVSSAAFAQTRVAATTVTNRSLQFLPTDPVFLTGFGNVRTYFTTYDGRSGFSFYDQVAGGLLLGGEFRPRAGALGVYEADYGTYSLVGALIDTGSFAFQIPTTDSDANGLPDVVQIDKNGSVNIGGSGLSDNGTPFSAAGTITRAAGSSTGTYRVNVVSATGLTNVIYTGTVNLVAFTGTVSYQRGSTNTITVNVRYTLDQSSTVTATTNFTVVNADRIDVPQFTARSSNGTSVTFRAGSLSRQGNAYRGDFLAIDGNPGTSWSDYLNYRWEIANTNDLDGN